ncbi:MAG TPA: AraC family transcriptional regulator [Pyrinomonadaceae bacterium]
MMREVESKAADSIGPDEWLEFIKFKPAEASNRLNWLRLQAAHFRGTPSHELNQPVLTDHMLVLFARQPDEFDLRYEGVRRHVPPPTGSIMVVPAGSPLRVRSSGAKDQLHIFLKPRLVERVAHEAFELDPAQLMIPALDGLDLPKLRIAMQTVGNELITSGPGGPLAAESMANVLAVHLIRLVLKPRESKRVRDSALSRSKLRVIVEYIEANLESNFTLEQMAATVHLSAYHFARQFKVATGMAPHRFVIARRVDRAQQLLQEELDLSLAEIALRAGFSDQSQFTHHFRRVVGVTPKHFRKSARIA